MLQFNLEEEFDVEAQQNNLLIENILVKTVKHATLLYGDLSVLKHNIITEYTQELLKSTTSEKDKQIIRSKIKIIEKVF